MPLNQIIIPNEISSVNGSNRTMGCSQFAVLDTFTYCGSLVTPVQSVLSDGIFPVIDRSDPDWASGLLTVKKGNSTNDIETKHILLTFNFAKKEHVATIYLDLLLCPEWNIGAPYITVVATSSVYLYLDLFGGVTGDFFVNYQPDQTTCGCGMSTIVIPVQVGEPASAVWHILITFEVNKAIEWVHVGEVRFSDVPIASSAPKPEMFCTPQDIPGEYQYSYTTVF